MAPRRQDGLQNPGNRRPGKVGPRGHGGSRGSGGQGEGRDLSHDGPAENIIVGRHPVREALRSGRALHRVLLRVGLEPKALHEFRTLAREAGVPVDVVDARRLASLAGDLPHQGVVAIGSAKEYVSFDELVERAAQREAGGLLLLLDGIQDPQNLGSLLRSADAAGVDGVVVPKRRSVGLTAAASRASAGAMEHVAVARVTNLVQAMERLKGAGFWIVGADAGAGRLAWEADLTGPLAIVVGSEGKGLSRLVKARCDDLVRFPMAGRVQSLNAGVAGALLMFEVVRQRWLKSKGREVRDNVSGAVQGD